MRKLALTAVALGVLGIGAAGCSSTYSREKTVDNLVEDGGLTEEQANCIVDVLEDEVGTEVLDENVEKDPEEWDPELTDAMVTASIDCIGA